MKFSQFPSIFPLLCTKIKQIQLPNAPILEGKEQPSALTQSFPRLGPFGILFSKLTAGLKKVCHHHLEHKAAVLFWLEFSINLTKVLLAFFLKK
jgi:hypothetical protein